MCAAKVQRGPIHDLFCRKTRADISRLIVNSTVREGAEALPDMEIYRKFEYEKEEEVKNASKGLGHTGKAGGFLSFKFFVHHSVKDKVSISFWFGIRRVYCCAVVRPDFVVLSQPSLCRRVAGNGSIILSFGVSRPRESRGVVMMRGYLRSTHGELYTHNPRGLRMALCVSRVSQLFVFLHEAPPYLYTAEDFKIRNGNLVAAFETVDTRFMLIESNPTRGSHVSSAGYFETCCIVEQRTDDVQVCRKLERDQTW